MISKKLYLWWVMVCACALVAVEANGQTEAERYAVLGQKALADGQFAEARMTGDN
jgi:hypothetical protein